ncbi:hypothetical protein OR571_18350 [Psychrobacillus sp. NEAU-3TGS]|uniref:hypothetical protein n=1 Tax=Psychrobacillus sp. NEAU-3TGS TaxID=2995412 RepID=UPI0024978787|nr:hypothetical protein [Psychrobacillus sp. NEAU-3TGS]MDI2589001.1 hypothetical protein [Psychrobacillus sp. NEAU-3TGS]
MSVLNIWLVASGVLVKLYLLISLRRKIKKQICNFSEFLVGGTNILIKRKISNELAITTLDFFVNGVSEIKFSDGESMTTDYTYSNAHLVFNEDEMWVKQSSKVRKLFVANGVQEFFLRYVFINKR